MLSKTPLSAGKGFKKTESKLKVGGKLKNTTRVKTKSNKQKEVDVEYRKVCEEIALEREHICTGCGNTETLSHSHLVPRSRRPDLVAVKENIVYHCLGNDCHNKWESPRRVTLLDYNYNMGIVERLDYEYYELLKMKQQHKK